MYNYFYQPIEILPSEIKKTTEERIIERLFKFLSKKNEKMEREKIKEWLKKGTFISTPCFKYVAKIKYLERTLEIQHNELFNFYFIKLKKRG
jgi:ribosomal protein S16